MTTIVEDINNEIEFFFTDLNWTFVFIFVIILYGIKHKEEFKWFNVLVKKDWWDGAKHWIAGLIVLVFFCIFRALGPDEFHSEYVSQALRSFIVVIVFNTILSRNIKKYDK